MSYLVFFCCLFIHVPTCDHLDNVYFTYCWPSASQLQSKVVPTPSLLLFKKPLDGVPAAYLPYPLAGCLSDPLKFVL